MTRAKVVDWLMMVLVVGLLGWAAFSFMQPSALGQLEGQPAPPFKLRTQSGAEVTLEEHRGKVVLLDFWATWCDPCLRQMPALREIDEELGDEVEVLAINVDEPSGDRAALMKNFLKEAEIEIDALVDDGTVAQTYGIESIPTLVIVDPDGVVYWASKGVHERGALEERIEAARGGP